MHTTKNQSTSPNIPIDLDLTYACGTEPATTTNNVDVCNSFFLSRLN